MRGPRTPKQKDAYKRLRKRVGRYGRKLQALFDKFTEDTADIVATSGYNADSDTPFKFKDYPMAAKKFATIKARFAKDVQALIEKSSEAEVNNADKISDELAETVVKAYGGQTDSPDFSPYFAHVNAAMAAYLAKRRDGKHGWSKRVWNIAETNGRELELSVSAAIKDGKAASRLAAEIKKYLNEPNRLFRRVRNEFGQLVLSRNAKLYHPGQGVYRSSFKNALRLAATEINAAYRQAENERWKKMDFIVGVEIHLSDSHPKYDICDELQGKYPVAFGTTWTGWHPNCFCYKTSILKSEEEFWALDQSKPSKNEVKDMPEGWYRWAAENAERIKDAAARGKEPWFIRDNKPVWDATLRMLDSEKDVVPMRGIIGVQKLGRKNSKEAYEAFRAEGEEWVPSPAQIKNAKVVAEELGAEYVSPMGYAEADHWGPNLGHAAKNSGYQENCPACVAAYEMRRRGINVTAEPYSPGNKVDSLGDNTWSIWASDANGEHQIEKPRYIDVQKLGKKANAKIQARMAAPGRYHIGYDYMVDDVVDGKLDKYERGHIIAAEKLRNGKLVLYDPQTNTNPDLRNVIDGAIRVQILKVDILYLKRGALSGIVRGV